MRYVLSIVLVTLTGGPLMAAPPELDGFPTKVAGKNRTTGLLLVDLDADKKIEIVTVSLEGVGVVESSGKLRPGFHAKLANASLKRPGAPVTCDLNGDGRPEIVIASYDKRLWAIRADGRPLAGYPLTLDGVAKGPATCLDGKTLLLTTDAGSLVKVSGKSSSRIAKIGWGAVSGVAVADIDQDSKPEYLVSGGDRKLYALDGSGRTKRGFPYLIAGGASGIPAVGDIDDDGRPDIVVGSTERKVHAVSATGKSLAGFPVKTALEVLAGPALADLDGDHVLDVVIGSGDGKLHAFKKGGGEVAGFPIKTDAAITTDAVVGDLDRDGKLEIAVVTQKGSLYLLSHTGKVRSGFPVKLGGRTDVAPALGDLDGDGNPELVAQGGDGTLHAFVFEPKGDAKDALLAWPMVGHSPSHGARFGPNPARFKTLTFASVTPATDAKLAVKYEFFDLDGDSEAETQIRWYKNGKHQSGFDNQRTIAAGETKKHERWRYSLQEGHNFEAYGPDNALSRVHDSPEVEILNTPPTVPKITFGPSAPNTTAALVAKVTSNSSDVDGDRISYRFKWRKNGETQQRLGFEKTKIDAKLTGKNERWSVEVCAFDGEEEGDFQKLALDISNSPPGSPKITFAPATARTTDAISVKITRAAPDADGDKITYAHRYWVNGKILNIPETHTTIPARSLRKNAKVKVRVTAGDGQVVGGHAEAELQVLNSAPAAPKLAIWPAKPRTTDELRFALISQKPDPDGDSLVFTHRWSVDGVASDLPAAVPSAKTKKGQRWLLSVETTDGTQKLPAVTAQTVIENSPPTPPLMALDGVAFFTDQLVTPAVRVPARDADGDRVYLSYYWRRNGKKTKVPTTQAALNPGDTRKGEQWELEVLPSDATVVGPSTTVRFAIKNSPPSAPVVKLSRMELTVRDSTSVSIATAAGDKDGDKLRYRYRWFQNGKPLGAWPKTKTKFEPGEGKSGDEWRVEARAFDGEAEGPAGSATFRLLNHAPGPPAVKLAPSPARSTDPLECKVQKAAKDPDANPLTYRTRWIVNGKPFPFNPDPKVLPANITNKGEVWQCEMAAFDGELSSKAVRSQKVTILNTPPRRPVVAIVPRKPTTHDDLTCELANPSSDADGEILTYKYSWRVGKKPYKAAAKSKTPQLITAKETKRGQSWTCEVVPSDTEAAGEKASAAVAIANSIPSQPVVAISPKRPKANDTLKCQILEPSTDIDRDKIKYEFMWFKDGRVQGFAPTSTEVPGRLVKANDLWKCTVTPSDGISTGKTAESRVVPVGR